MLQYRRIIRSASSSGQAHATHRRSEISATAKSSTSLARGLDHLFSLSKDPLALSWLKDVTTHAEALGVESTSWSDSGRTDDLDSDDLDKQAVELELRRYEEDGLFDITSLVEFWGVGMVYPMSQTHFPLTWPLLQKHEHVIQSISPLRWTCCQPKQRLFPVKGYFRPARKHAPCAAASLVPPQSRCFKS